MEHNKVLVSGYLGFNNFGDEAIFFALSCHLKNLGFRVSALCFNKENFKKTYQVETYEYKSIPEIVSAILSCNVLISGGGSLLQNKTSNFSLYYYLFIIFLAKLFLKKVVIFAQGIEPIRGKFNNFLVMLILKMTDFISVRDIKSLELLKENGIQAKLLSDPVYSLLQNRKISDNKNGLIVQLRKLTTINNDFISNLAEAINNNYKSTNISVFSFQDEYDKEFCLEFIDGLKKYGIDAKLISNKSIEETIEIINSSKYMISTRLHGIIVSKGVKTQVFALVYDDKIRTISDELNIPNIDLTDYSKNELDEKLCLFFNSKDNSGEYRRFSWNEIDNFLLNIKGKDE